MRPARIVVNARNKGAPHNHNVRPNNVLLSRVCNLSMHRSSVLCNRVCNHNAHHNNAPFSHNVRRSNMRHNNAPLSHNVHRSNMHNRNSRIMRRGQSITGKIFIKQKPRLCIAGVFVLLILSEN
jgi:hypothetical protein